MRYNFAPVTEATQREADAIDAADDAAFLASIEPRNIYTPRHRCNVRPVDSYSLATMWRHFAGKRAA